MTIKELKLKLRIVILKIMNKEEPDSFDLAILKVLESHDQLEEELAKAKRRTETLEAMVIAGSEPSLREN